MAAPFPPPVGAGEAETRAALAWLRASGDWPAVALTPATAELEWDEGENACVAPAGPSGRLLFAVYRDGEITSALILFTREGDLPLDSQMTVDLPAHVLGNVLRGEAA